MDALILVDIQNDFLPGGTLAVPLGDEVIDVANRLMARFDLVVATQDWHPADHRSFASQHRGKQLGDVIELGGVSQVLWPDHCVQHTPGAAFADRLHTDHFDRIFLKGTQPDIDSYSGFYDNARRKTTGLAEYLRGRGVGGVCIVGLATDYCVKATALDARDEGFRTNVVLEGVRGVDVKPGDIAAACDQMRAAGVELVREADAIAGGRDHA